VLRQPKRCTGVGGQARAATSRAVRRAALPAKASAALRAQPSPGPDRDIALIRQASALLAPDAPDDLVRTALLLCGDCEMASQYRTGIDLMIRGLDACLHTLPSDAATATPYGNALS
jgi:hypothetical protein